MYPFTSLVLRRPSTISQLGDHANGSKRDNVSCVSGVVIQLIDIRAFINHQHASFINDRRQWHARCCFWEKEFGGITKIFLTFGFLLVTWCLATAADLGNQASGNPEIARGKYIVDQVAMCVQCHTPRTQSGQLLATRYLQGAAVPVAAPPSFQIDWAYKAPAIAGLPGYTRQEGIRLLMEGITPDRRTPKAPMPKFRLTRADAEAVVDYLKSLP